MTTAVKNRSRPGKSKILAEAALKPAAKLPTLVSVRMYRQGLGDCFLLTFTGRSGPRYMLIDCGVIMGTPDAAGRMSAVANDILQTTAGRIDVVVGTHEHWDHLSGFVQAKATFDKIIMQDVWLAWTEDPSDPLARELIGARRKAVAALRQAALRLQAAGSPLAQPLTNVLEFAGPLAAGASTEDALSYLRRRVKRPRYCRPGQQLSIPDVDGVRVYVLGPPENAALIRKADATRAGKEVYEMAFSLDSESAFQAAMQHQDNKLAGLTPDQLQQLLSTLPFDRALQVTPKQAADDVFFQQHYWQRDMDWRRIDTDWMDAAGSLALKLDNDTNNTSLVLAVELIDSGEVLLFAADAQVGNWESWFDLSWPETSGKTTAADLLARTVFYKVGHHASHNATLRAQGLELMNSGSLVAMIPVDEQIAREKKHWNMPFPSLLHRLEQKTQGRVLRADRSLAQHKAADRPAALSAGDWRQFCSQLTADPKDELYLEWRAVP